MNGPTKKSSMPIKGGPIASDKRIDLYRVRKSIARGLGTHNRAVRSTNERTSRGPNVRSEKVQKAELGH